MVGNFESFEKTSPRKECFKKPGPEQERYQDLRSLRGCLAFAQFALVHEQQHNGHPEWNANQVIKVIEREGIRKVRLENPPIYKIKRQTSNE